MDDMMMSASPAEAVGQVVFVNTSASLLTTDWTVPAGVTSVSTVCVEPGATDGGGFRYAVLMTGTFPFFTEQCKAQQGARIGDGGGNGGAAGSTGIGGVGAAEPGCGGAGGYSGNGGNGGNGGTTPTAGAAGSGGGGGGGGGAVDNYRTGGGVGLLGQGTSGTGSSTRFGNPGSGGSGAAYGAGVAVIPNVNRGGCLSYKNNIAVTPGATLRVVISGSPAGTTAGAGAVRIMWGGGRSYPFNAGDA